MAPGKVELMIHQVVDMFQINIATYVHIKKFLRLMPCISIHNNGTNATKIRNVSGETGQAAYASKPERIDNSAG